MDGEEGAGREDGGGWDGGVRERRNRRERRWVGFRGEGERRKKINHTIILDETRRDKS